MLKSEYERKRRLIEGLPHEITQQEIDKFNQICKKYDGIATVTPFTPKLQTSDIILAKQIAPRIAEVYIARIVGLRNPPTWLLLPVHFLKLPEERQIDRCGRVMYSLDEAEAMKNIDEHLKIVLDEITMMGKLKGREALKEAYLETCRRRILRYFQILATPSLLEYQPLEIIPRTPGAQIISNIVCRVPKPPQPKEKTEEEMERRARTTELVRKEIIAMVSEIYRLNLKAPYILEIDELPKTKTTITRYVDPTISETPTIDVLKVELTIGAEPKVPDEKLETIRAYLTRYTLREIRAKAKEKEDEEVMLKLTAIAIYMDKLKRTIEAYIKNYCRAVACRYAKHIYIPTTVEITTEEEIISRLLTSGWRAIERIPKEVKTGALKIEITACATTYEQLRCLLEVTDPTTIRAIVEGEAKRLGFIEF